MKQVWLNLSVKADSLEDAKQKAEVIGHNCNVKDVTAYADKVTYKQLTWDNGVGEDEEEL